MCCCVYRFIRTHPFQFRYRSCCSLGVSSTYVGLIGATLLHAGPLLVKDEYDYDNQQSHSSSESHLQTIQHPPSRPGPQEPFNGPSLLPPSEASGSASTSAFSTISAGPSSESLRGTGVSIHVALEPQRR